MYGEKLPPEVEEAVRKHVERELEGMDPEVKKSAYFGKNDKEILKHYLDRVGLQEDGNIMIGQSFGFYVIDKNGETVPDQGYCCDDSF